MTESLGICKASGKRMYENRGIARSAAKGLNGRRTHEPKAGAYHCHDCGRWHLGRPPQVEKSRNHATKNGPRFSV